MESTLPFPDRRTRQRHGRIDEIFTITYQAMRKTSPELFTVTEGFSAPNYVQTVENKPVENGQFS